MKDLIDPMRVAPVATAAIVAAKLRAINPDYPAADPAAAGEMAKARAELVTEVSPSAA
jgi:hypothetical protein